MSSAFSYSYTAYSLMTGDNTLALNPYVFADGTGYVGTDLLVSYGITNKCDMFFSYYMDNKSLNDFSIMARYDLKRANILALKASPSAASIQYHTIKENNKFAFQANASLSFNYDNMKKPDISAVVAPVVKIGTTGFDVYCEVNPSLYGTNKFSLDVIPGVGVTVKDVLLSISMPVYDVINSRSPSFGMWAFFTIVSR
jgi:hypothetical protein